MTAIIQETVAPQEPEFVYNKPKEDVEFDEKRSEKLHTSQRFKVVFPIDDGRVSEQAFELAIQTAKRFSATLVLVYLAKPFVLSDGLREYAKVEGIRDYEWLHYETLSRTRLESFGKRADEEGVIWEGTFSLGGTRSVLKTFSCGNTFVVLNGEGEKKNINRGWSKFLGLFGSTERMVRAKILLI